MTASTEALETLKALLLDFHETRLETGVPRHLALRPVRGKAAVCIGVRRSGKSTYLFQIIERLVASGVPRQNILYLNFFDDRLHRVLRDDLGLVSEAYFSLFPEKKSSETVYCFFDEVQVAAGWERFVDRLLCTEQCQVYLTGSSAHMLSKEIATQLRGRALAWEIFPFSFREFLDHTGVAAAGPLSTKQRLLVQRGFDRYFETGGFPEVAALDRGLRTKIHQEYFHTILFRDLVERHDVAHPRAVSDLAHWLIDNVGSLYTVNRLTGYLQALGHKAPKMAVADYLAWLEDAYFFFTVRLFDTSLTRSNANPKKVYCVDHGLVTSVASGAPGNVGHRLESLVFMALRREHQKIFYYRTATGSEVDFLVVKGRSKKLIQVCATLAEPPTRKREVAALSEAMAELGLRSSTLVTRGERERIATRHGAIDVVPAWQFVLDAEDR